MAEVELVTAFEVAVAGFKEIRWELAIFGFLSWGAFGGITLMFTKGGFELAHANAWRLVLKNLSITTALRSEVVRPE